MIKLTVLNKRVGPVRGRHPWVFSGAIKQIPDGIESGEPVQLFDENGDFLALGYFNSYSQIAVRLWGYEEEEINLDFFVKRISNAYQIRKELVLNKKTNACRLINGESDLLPGLIVDQYDEYLSVQFHTKGIEKWKKEITEALIQMVEPRGVYERSDVRDRVRDSKEEVTGVLHGKVPDQIVILENGFKFEVDVKTGQKTGFFLDQRDKRLAIQKYAVGKKVLNCFSYTGGFSVYALAAGASKVVSIDASRAALEIAEKNIELNKLEAGKCEFILGDVKEYLRDQVEQNNEFDVIILDPPAFVKDRHKIKEGLNGYRNINEAALKILPPGGILVTCSCSAHVSLEDFRFMLSEAAARVGRTVKILETFTHAPDHPVLAAFTEGEYLKCFFAVVD